MKHIFKVTLCVVLIFGLLIGCSPAPEVASESKTPEKIMDNFEKMLEPIADQFEMSIGEKVELSDVALGLPAVITDKIFSKTYQLLISYTEAGGAYSAMLIGDYGATTKLDFALLSFYLYESLNLPEMEAQDFYDHFNMLTKEPDGTMSTDEWFLSTTTLDAFLTFGALYSPE